MNTQTNKISQHFHLVLILYFKIMNTMTHKYHLSFMLSFTKAQFLLSSLHKAQKLSQGK